MIKNIVLTIVIIIMLYLIYQGVMYHYKIKKVNKIKNNKNITHKNNKLFLELYEKNKQLDSLLLDKYNKNKVNFEIQNYNQSYTPKTLLDDRVRIHIDLNNEDFKDTLGL